MFTDEDGQEKYVIGLLQKRKTNLELKWGTIVVHAILKVGCYLKKLGRHLSSNLKHVFQIMLKGTLSHAARHCSTTLLSCSWTTNPWIMLHIIKVKGLVTP